MLEPITYTVHVRKVGTSYDNPREIVSDSGLTFGDAIGQYQEAQALGLLAWVHPDVQFSDRPVSDFPADVDDYISGTWYPAPDPDPEPAPFHPDDIAAEDDRQAAERDQLRPTQELTLNGSNSDGRYQVHAMTRTGSHVMRYAFDLWVIADLKVRRNEWNDACVWIVDSREGTPPEGLTR